MRNTGLVVVPARLSSTRLPRKMLLRETGQYLFEHTARNALRAERVRAVWVAVDDASVAEAATEVGLRALETDPAHPSGTDRVREAAQKLRESGALEERDIVVNVQGDEPELAPGDLDALLAAFEDPEVDIATLWAPIGSAREAEDPASVKLVLDARGRALYFSRSRLPSLAHPSAQADPSAPHGRRHVGVYAFRLAALERCCALAVGRLERAEGLEQLRWLEAGESIHVLEASAAPPGIDTADDYAAFVQRVRAGATPPAGADATGASSRPGPPDSPSSP